METPENEQNTDGRELVFQKIKSILESPMGFETKDLSEETNLKQLGLDNLHEIELCVELEKHFDKTISDEKQEKWETIKDVIDCCLENPES